LSIQGGRKVIGKSVPAIAHNRHDDSVGVDFLDAIIAAIGEKEIAGAIEEERVGPVERSITTGHGCNVAVGADSADSVIQRIGNEKIPCRINRESGRKVQLGFTGKPPIAIAAVAASARDRLNPSRSGVDAADLLVV